MKQILRGAVGSALIPFFACPVYITMLLDHYVFDLGITYALLLTMLSCCCFRHTVNPCLIMCTFCLQVENRSSTAEYRCPSANCWTRDTTDANYSSKHWRPALEDISFFFSWTVEVRANQAAVAPNICQKSTAVAHWCTVGANRCQSNRSRLSSAHFFGLYR